MSCKYKLVQRKNPQAPEEPKKWYATPNSSRPLSEREMVKEATKNTTVAPGEFRTAMELLTDFIPSELRQGHTVKVPGLGTFRLMFGSQGAEKVEDFNANEMIRNLRIVFTPEAEFREKVLLHLDFEDGGVMDNGVTYATRSDYYNRNKPAAGEEGTQG